MSIIPRNNQDSPFPFTPFPQDFWDRFFPPHLLDPFTDFPFFARARTVPYAEFALETSGNARARMECKEVPEAHIFVAELPGVGRDEVDVVAEEGGGVRVSGGGFVWRFKLPETAKVHLMSWSMEEGVLTVVVPKVAVEVDGDVWRPRNVRQIEISGLDD